MQTVSLPQGEKVREDQKRQANPLPDKRLLKTKKYPKGYPPHTFKLTQAQS